MPFDSATDLPALRRSILAEALRNNAEWRWNFCDTAGCAIGMAAALWPDKLWVEYRPGETCGPVSRAADFFGLSFREAARIFGDTTADAKYQYGLAAKDVTPKMVADALEQIAS